MEEFNKDIQYYCKVTRHNKGLLDRFLSKTKDEYKGFRDSWLGNWSENTYFLYPQIKKSVKTTIDIVPYMEEFNKKSFRQVSAQDLMDFLPVKSKSTSKMEEKEKVYVYKVPSGITGSMLKFLQNISDEYVGYMDSWKVATKSTVVYPQIEDNIWSYQGKLGEYNEIQRRLKPNQKLVLCGSFVGFKKLVDDAIELKKAKGLENEINLQQVFDQEPIKKQLNKINKNEKTRITNTDRRSISSGRAITSTSTRRITTGVRPTGYSKSCNIKKSTIKSFKISSSIISK